MESFDFKPVDIQPTYVIFNPQTGDILRLTGDKHKTDCLEITNDKYKLIKNISKEFLSTMTTATIE